MERAVVLIGVGRVAGMEHLPAVEDGIEQMRDWALGQGLAADRVTILTDKAGPVTFDAVFSAIAELAELRTIEQLVIHFCGHGLLVDGSEVWLLSGAGDRGDQAINLAQSKYHADRGRFPHVVLVSDACRTVPLDPRPPTGGSMFALGKGQTTRYVNLLFATQPGAAALQVATTARPSGDYTAVYTTVLAEALRGEHREVVESVADDEGPARIVRLALLKERLPALVADRFTLLKSSALAIPDGYITWESGESWISRLPGAALPDIDGTDDRRGPTGLPAEWQPAADPLVELAHDAARRLRDLPPAGAGPLSVVGADVMVTDDPEQDDALGFRSVTLRLLGDRLAVVPVFSWGVTRVVVEDGQLVDLSIDPGDDGGRMSEQRAWMGAASRYRLPWWDAAPVEAMIEATSSLVDQDPTAAVLVAHALVDRGRQDLVRELLRETSLPDVLLLAGPAASEDPRAGHPRMRVPFYSRTWALLGADGVAPRPEAPPRVPSPWSLFLDLPL